MVKKDENVKRLETNLQEAAKQLASMKVALPKVLEEREEMCKEVNDCRKINMDLELEKEMLKEVKRFEEDTLLKEGQITTLKDTLGSKHFDLLSSPDFSYNEFLVQYDKDNRCIGLRFCVLGSFLPYKLFINSV